MSPLRVAFPIKPAPRADLKAIIRFSARRSGRPAAEPYAASLVEAFVEASESPTRVPIRAALIPPLRVAFRGSHVILFQETERWLEIVRVRHQWEAWALGE